MILDAKRIFVHLSPFNISIYLIYLSIYLSIYLFLATPKVACGGLRSPTRNCSGSTQS